MQEMPRAHRVKFNTSAAFYSEIISNIFIIMNGKGIKWIGKKWGQI